MTSMIELFGYKIAATEFAKYSLFLNLVFIVIFAIIYLFSFEVTLLWLKAWFYKKPISLEWGKDKKWHFSLPDIPKGFPYMWQLGRKKRSIEVRRDAVGTAPHKIPMMLSVAEFGAAVSCEEINGKAYYSPQNIIYAVKIKNQITGKETLKQVYQPGPDATETEKQMWEEALPYVQYPQHGLNPTEFVEYQTVNTDPVITQTFADYQEIEARRDIMNPVHAITENLHFLIPFMIVAAIAWSIFQDHLTAGAAMGETMACRRELQECVLTGGKSAIESINASLVKTGGVIN